jgi:hypothetical protein
MVNTEICQLLKTNENQLFDLFASQPLNFWEMRPEGKWTAGQHVIHLVQSTEQLLKALKLPDFFLKWKFGTNNRSNRSYAEIIEKYKEKLTAVSPSAVSPFSRNMPDSPATERHEWLSRLSALHVKVNKLTEKLSDKQMDTILLPHPLMGRMTLREILMWNAYHLEHHIAVLNKKYINQTT